MKINTLLSALSTDTSTQTHGIYDASRHCSYAQIPALFAQLDQGIAAQYPDLPTPTCIAFEAQNTVLSALTLLYLFSKGHSVVLLPAAGAAQKEPGFKPSIPAFCPYWLTMGNEGETEVSAELLLQNFSLRPHEDYNGHQVSSGKVYVRTSGSMGAAKVVVHSQDNLLINAESYATRYRLESSDRLCIPVPIFHLYGFGAGFLSGLSVGLDIDLIHQTNILKYLDRERKFKPNAAFFTPSFCEMLLKGKRSEGQYKLVVTSGEPIKESVFREFDARFGSIISQYGSTEMGAIAAADPLADLELRATSTGKAMPHISFDLKTEDEQADLTILYCRSPYSFEGYLDDSGKVIASNDKVAWYRTGDLVKDLGKGYISILGRADNRINRRGFLVLLSDIEQKLETLADVDKAIVISTDKQTAQGQALVAFCRLNRGVKIEPATIRSQSFDTLPKYAVPDAVQIVRDFPRLANGKLDRQSLRKLADG